MHGVGHQLHTSLHFTLTPMVSAFNSLLGKETVEKRRTYIYVQFAKKKRQFNSLLQLIPTCLIWSWFASFPGDILVRWEEGDRENGHNEVHGLTIYLEETNVGISSHNSLKLEL